jgi:hypothetical protein
MWFLGALKMEGVDSSKTLVPIYQTTSLQTVMLMPECINASGVYIYCENATSCLM